jgi:hypothetical protein
MLIFPFDSLFNFYLVRSINPSMFELDTIDNDDDKHLLGLFSENALNNFLKKCFYNFLKPFQFLGNLFAEHFLGNLFA